MDATLPVTVLLAALAVLAVNASPTRTLVTEALEVGAERPAQTPHAQLTLAIQHAAPEPPSSRPEDEDALQRTRRKRAHEDQEAVPDQEAAASSHEEDEEDSAEDRAHDDTAAAASGDDADMFLEPEGEGAAFGSSYGAASTTGAPAASAASAASPDATAQPQNLFPAFQPLFPLGHSRPPIFQEPAFSQRQPLLRPQQLHPYHVGPHGHGFAETREPRLDLHAFRERAYPQAGAIAAPAELQSNALLGSGNFGVIHGGTFYGEEKESQDYDSPLHSFYSGNGHGRPAFFRGNPEPQRYRTSEDFFANFRDFADISTPTKSSFSEYYVVLVNRNASRADPGTVVGPDGGVVQPGAPAAPASAHAKRPNNIFERLAQIDREHALLRQHDAAADSHEEAPQKKVSLGKRKLALLDKKKAGKRAADASDASRGAAAATPRDSPHEPLLALS